MVFLVETRILKKAAGVFLQLEVCRLDEGFRLDRFPPEIIGDKIAFRPGIRLLDGSREGVAFEFRFRLLGRQIELGPVEFFVHVALIELVNRAVLVAVSIDGTIIVIRVHLPEKACSSGSECRPGKEFERFVISVCRHVVQYTRAFQRF